MASAELIQAVAVTAELCGRVFSEPAARVFVQDLSAYDERHIIEALRRCRREVRGILTVQDVVSRIDDGRPGPDEAWALIPHDEAESTVWSQEIATAWGVAMRAHDRQSQRLAFREAYAAEVAKARDAGIPVQWSPSLGHDPRRRATAIAAAVEKGRLSLEHGRDIVPELPAPSAKVLRVLGDAVKKIGAA
jgi:hypothetical protein